MCYHHNSVLPQLGESRVGSRANWPVIQGGCGAGEFGHDINIVKVTKSKKTARLIKKCYK